MQEDGIGIDSGKIERIKQLTSIDDEDFFQWIMALKEKYEKTVEENNKLFDKNIK